MEKEEKELANLLQSIDAYRLHERAKRLIDAGYIHKSKAIEYCEPCIHCIARGFIPDCGICQGRGIVLKEGK